MIVSAILILGLGLSVPALAAHEPVLRVVLDGHRKIVTSVAIAPNDDFVVSGSMDGTVRIWDLATGKERAILTGHAGLVWAVKIMDEGATIGSTAGARRSEFKLWDVATAKETQTIKGGFIFSPDGSMQAVTSDGSRIMLRDVATGQNRILDRPSRYSQTAPWGFTRNGKTLIASSYMDEIVLWDTDSGRERMVIPDNSVLSTTIAPDETILAAGPGADGGPVKLWDMTTGALVTTLSGHTSRVWQVAFSPDGKLLASAGWDGALRLWDVATGELLTTLTGLSRFYTVAFTSDGMTLVAGGGGGGRGDPEPEHGRIMVWKLGSQQ